jgi:CIC family chloride channel protein
MFALEIILGDFGLATFSPIVISSVVATAVSRHFLGNSPAFIVPAYQLVSAWELPLYVILGLFCALVAVTFTAVLYRTEDLFDQLKFPEYLKAALGGLMLGLMALLFPHILGVGYPAIDLSLMQELSWQVLFLLIVFKVLATSITIGSGGSGGIFAPSLFLGAMAGGFFGTVVHGIFPSITAPPGAYGIVGMGAVVSGTTHGPLSAILILFELTGDYKIILPLMMACIMSTLASGQLLRDSIYTLKLARRGINIRAGKEVNVLRSIPVGDVMNPHVETIPENITLGGLAEKISKSKYKSFPVVDEEGNLTGVLTHFDYRDVVFEAKEVATTNPVTVSFDDNLYIAMEKITLKDFSILPVVSPGKPPRLLGVLTRRDIISAYNRAVIKKSVME